jgi:DNA-binding NarL/FixJ family response regulator
MRTPTAKAVADIAALHPDVVTIDIALKDGTGFDVLESLANDYDQPPLRIVLSNFTSRLSPRGAQNGRGMLPRQSKTNKRIVDRANGPAVPRVTRSRTR